MEQLLMLQGVRQVSERANPSAPEEVTQRAFDAARAGSTFPDLPAARNITRALGVPWGEVLRLAHQPETVRAHRLSMKQRERGRDWLTDEHVSFALRAVALRLGGQAPSLSQYRVERARILNADRARFLHGRQLLLPDDEQVIAQAGSWPKALRLAGLEDAPTGMTTQRVKVPTLVELMERFCEHYGTQPTRTALEAFASGNGIPHPRSDKQGFRDALAAWAAKRAKQGLPVAPPAPPKHKHPDYVRDVGAARPGEHRRSKRRTAEECVAWVRRYLEELPSGARSTQRSYLDWARGCEGAPGPSSLAPHGGFAHVRRLAQEQMRAGAASDG
jgi:hypothetical protein